MTYNKIYVSFGAFPDMTPQPEPAPEEVTEGE